MMVDYYSLTVELYVKKYIIQESVREFVNEEMRSDISKHWVESTHDIHTLILGENLIGFAGYE